MKTKSILATVVLTGAALLAAATLRADPPAESHRGGTDILHLELQAQMQNDGVESNATGTVTLEQNTQGHADHQQLQVVAKGLDTNATYFLCAMSSSTNLTLAGTNFVTLGTNLVVVDQANADAKGRVSFCYRGFVQGHGHSGALHGHLQSLPAALQPVSALQELALADTNLQVVLSADLTSSNRLDCLIKRTLTNGMVDATLWVKATPRHANLRLMGTGLTPQTDYYLVLDGGICDTNTSNSKGRLALGFELDHPLDILNVSTVALWDTSSNVVVSTQLP